MTTARLLAALALCAVVAGGCQRRGPRVRVAEIVEIGGGPSGVSIVDGAGGERLAHPPAGVAPGETVRTASGARAVLRFPDGRLVRLGERAQLRFVTAEGAPPALEVLLGRAQIEGGAAPLEIATLRGRTRLEAGSAMNIEAAARGTRYEVVLGRAVLGEAEVDLGPGDGIEIVVSGAALERYRVQIGGAVVEPLPHPAPVVAAPPPAEGAGDATRDEAPSVGISSAAGSADEAALATADLQLPAGESAVIHDARGLVRIALLPASACSRPAEVTLRRSDLRSGRSEAVTSRAGAVAALSPGSYRYRLRCPGEPPRGGALRVRRDNGTAPVPRVAPRNLLEADGRKYIVLYQNRLPAFRLTWPDAPPSGPYELHLARGDGARSEREQSDEPAVDLASGALGEGVHRFWFTAARVKTAATVVDIRFDNAATTAQILEPRASALPPVAAPVVAGVALEGSTVSVGGQTITVDRQGRFRGEIQVPPSRALAIRIAHPRQGVHYYVRRFAAGRALHAGGDAPVTR